MRLRLACALIASAILTAGLFLAVRLYFSDILPVADSETPQLQWRFETAFVLTSLAWIGSFVTARSAIALVVLLYKQTRRGG
ncbi:MAG TPA: hypothetical protein VGF02_00520 [Pseudolabrys sp.]|jgi:hypothetical protein